MISNVPRLTVVVLLPIFASLMIPILPRSGNRVIRWYTLSICILEFLPITYIFYCHFQIDYRSIQLLETFNWIKSIHLHWSVGIDGLSLGLVISTGFATTLATSAAWPITRNTRLFYFLMLIMYGGQIGLFVSRDILLFFFMWELELIPVYLLLCLWGGKRRLYSATKFVLYTAGGSIFLLIAALTMSFYNSEVPSFDIQDSTQKSYPLSLEILIYVGFLIAYAVKLPIFPFHTWLPDTHGEAHYSTSMLLAGVLLKMGGYGLIRINLEVLTHAHFLLGSWMMVLGAIQIIYASLISMSQRNFKIRIAYSSVSHMGFVTIGIGSLTETGIDGAILQMISHGLIGAALFFLAGTCYDRTRTYLLDELGGVAIPMPKLFTMFSIFSLASLALPGMSGFVSELIVFLGVVISKQYSYALKAGIAASAAVGTVLTPIYLLSMLRQLFYGYRSFDRSNLYSIDLGPRELFILICFLLPILAIGLYPNVISLIWNTEIYSLPPLHPDISR
uniref:NAD(P)H-quinone oxidoreductase chain 4, chloroplastic n=2 Tax=Adiantum TaxID=13817 RepID=A0A7M3UJB1_9MONI|nr:NADH-plastoquinone oxidoreductase subunit 4 [Adiantum nelumboides]YP_010341249.1 NADH-plastoquinone oxidoreductase subunit 4 [Adiantum reniforme var. sinense]QMQ99215.1 NADH-plastoquinone oxidoreductase subunit 4 [Adiantum nelumboides]QOH99676.1 NADH dehydrogenase subunit 4 [Adiantum reniforme var. sinense]UNZ94080.1 NADH-plastoquinone oxidoreductase subunit 4 [Adiantum reniforme var. sinense]